MPDLLACPQFASKLATLTFAEKTMSSNSFCNSSREDGESPETLSSETTEYSEKGRLAKSQTNPTRAQKNHAAFFMTVVPMVRRRTVEMTEAYPLGRRKSRMK